MARTENGTNSERLGIRALTKEQFGKEIKVREYPPYTPPTPPKRESDFKF